MVRVSDTRITKAPLRSRLLVRFMRPAVRLAQYFLWRNKLPEVARVEDRRVESRDADVPIRIYTPEGDGRFPVLVFFHGRLAKKPASDLGDRTTTGCEGPNSVEATLTQ